MSDVTVTYSAEVLKAHHRMAVLDTSLRQGVSSAERTTRTLAEGYGDPGDGYRISRPDDFGVRWLCVGHNASHEFYLGWTTDGRLFRKSVGEGPAEQHWEGCWHHDTLASPSLKARLDPLH